MSPVCPPTRLGSLLLLWGLGNDDTGCGKHLWNKANSGVAREGGGGSAQGGQGGKGPEAGRCSLWPGRHAGLGSWAAFIEAASPIPPSAANRDGSAGRPLPPLH